MFLTASTEERLVGVGLRFEVDTITGNVIVSQILQGGPAHDSGQVHVKPRYLLPFEHRLRALFVTLDSFASKSPPDPHSQLDLIPHTHTHTPCMHASYLAHLRATGVTRSHVRCVHTCEFIYICTYIYIYIYTHARTHEHTQT
jgi:hypothetical protein